MKTKMILILAATAALSACGPQVYVRSNADAVKFSTDLRACYKVADKQTRTNTEGNDPSPAEAYQVAISVCLKGDGWDLANR